MGEADFSDDFKRDAVAQIAERGYPVAEASNWQRVNSCSEGLSKREHR